MPRGLGLAKVDHGRCAVVVGALEHLGRRIWLDEEVWGGCPLPSPAAGEVARSEALHDRDPLVGRALLKARVGVLSARLAGLSPLRHRWSSVFVPDDLERMRIRALRRPAFSGWRFGLD